MEESEEDDLLIGIQYLADWGLSQTSIKAFEENQISLKLFSDIKDFELKELIPNIRERILFKQGNEKLKNMIHDTASEDTISLSDLSAPSSPASSIEVQMSKEITHERSDLKCILKTTNCGELCLASVNRNIDMTTRTNITKTIVEYYIKQHGSMSSRDFDDMSSQIIVLFPSECKETYYVPSRKYSAKSYIPARGKLVDRYHNQKRILKKASIANSPNAKPATAVNENDAEGCSTTVTTEEAKEHQLWLKYNMEPFVEILEKWHKTRQYRIKYLACHENTLHDILSEWPSLKTSLGYKLIETDFDVLHPNCGLNLLKKWPLFVEKALPLFKNLKSSELNILEENPVEDARDYIFFKLMAHKMPPSMKVPIKDNKKKFYKPSIVESQDAFILHVTNQSEIRNRLEQYQKMHLTRGTTFQPLIIAVGPKTKDVKDFYVAVDNILYKIDSVLKAVDVCFKIIHVLNVQYPLESISIWTFIQKYFYNITCQSDKKISSVSCFMSDLL